ncbi:competence protein ComK [Metabacillus sp. Hm71]|uniref:competence protein ComK n=1 Tax=Metabacillus sp. Hm71 TaxID=3450743 RepID=UPI003F422BFB
MNELKNVLEDYIINRFTMAIIPDSNRMYSEVIEYEEEVVVHKRPMEIIDQSCRYFGSSYSGTKVIQLLKRCRPNKSLHL